MNALTPEEVDSINHINEILGELENPEAFVEADDDDYARDRPMINSVALRVVLGTAERAIVTANKPTIVWT